MKYSNKGMFLGLLFGLIILILTFIDFPINILGRIFQSFFL
jgi:hypothetical protein